MPNYWLQIYHLLNGHVHDTTMSSTVVKQIVTEVIPLLSQSTWIGTRYDSYLYIIRKKHVDLMVEV